jgi:hypothetical protein
MAYWGLDIDSIMRQVNQRRAAGGYVSPNMLQDLIKANISNASAQSATQQSLENQAKGVENQGLSIAETARANTASEALRQKTLEQSAADTAAARALSEQQFGVTSREKEREFNTNTELANQARESAGTSNIASTLVSAPTSLWAGKKAYDWLFPATKPVATPGGTSSGGGIESGLGFENQIGGGDITSGTPTPASEAPVNFQTSMDGNNPGSMYGNINPASYTPYDPYSVGAGGNTLADTSASYFGTPTEQLAADQGLDVLGQTGTETAGAGLGGAAAGAAGGLAGGVAGSYLGSLTGHEQGSQMGGIAGSIAGAGAAGGPAGAGAAIGANLLLQGFDAFTGRGGFEDTGPHPFMQWLATPEGQAFDKADKAALAARQAEELRQREATANAISNPSDRIYQTFDVDEYGQPVWKQASGYAPASSLEPQGTWLCTEIARFIGLTDEDNADLSKLRRYSIRNHMKWIRAYLTDGHAIVEGINAKEEPKSFYAKLKKEMITPIIELIKDGKLEEAFKKYKEDTVNLAEIYSPELLKRIESF